MTTAGLLIDAAERFPLGARNGIVMPTAEPVSDTAVTPFGLTLRTIPTRRNVVQLRSVDGVITMATTKVTSITSDGDGEYEDVRYDTADDV